MQHDGNVGGMFLIQIELNRILTKPTIETKCILAVLWAVYFRYLYLAKLFPVSFSSEFNLRLHWAM